MPKFVMNPDGSFIEINTETRELLLAMYFPDYRDDVNEESEPKNFSALSIFISELVTSVIMYQKGMPIEIDQ